MIALNLLVLRCSDIERSRAFYELLGHAFTKHAHRSGPEHYAHEDERGVFELYPRKESGSGDQTGLGFAVPDLEQSQAAFAAAGFQPGALKDNPWGRSFVVRDPDGRRVEISQR
jgi:catechol 2,3-dioxygenase-like lactoylglutathione lyase family enzyme